jgi:hypothetical protein
MSSPRVRYHRNRDTSVGRFLPYPGRSFRLPDSAASDGPSSRIHGMTGSQPWAFLVNRACPQGLWSHGAQPISRRYPALGYILAIG